ncbi:hypothetical protein [Vreelandella populi]|uniref:Uncharacterized protein n=1 Tax=Vreelandella populi TaxID=2498858 RepID=A0A433LG08_9GAMM|nr:hypothetical protein [Halomonas populi]RUR48822.1 hypothetical protein ELY37_02940 [Halomonas populi]
MILTKYELSKLNGSSETPEPARQEQCSIRPINLRNPEYLRDLLRLPARKIQAKWGVCQTAVNNHQHLGAAEIRRRLAEVEA